MPGFVWAGSGALLSYKGCYCNTLRKVLWCTSTHATQRQAHSRYCQAGSMDKWLHWIVRRFLCLRRVYWAPVQDFTSKGVCSTRCVCVRRSYPPARTLCEHVGEKESESCKREIYKTQMGFSVFSHLLWQCSGGGHTGLFFTGQSTVFFISYFRLRYLNNYQNGMVLRIPALKGTYHAKTFFKVHKFIFS